MLIYMQVVCSLQLIKWQISGLCSHLNSMFLIFKETVGEMLSLGSCLGRLRVKTCHKHGRMGGWREQRLPRHGQGSQVIVICE